MVLGKTAYTDLNGKQLQILSGFRFTPCDQTLVLVYLRKKANSLPLPANIIPQLNDVFRHDPWDLPGENGETKFFFCTRTRNSSCIVKTGCGYWKRNVDEDVQIVANGTNSVVAIKKCWGFYTEESIETRWIMHQFCLVRAFDASLTKKSVVEVGKWNVYRIYERDDDECVDYDSLSSSCSSESSDDESSSDLDHEANS